MKLINVMPTDMLYTLYAEGRYLNEYSEEASAILEFLQGINATYTAEDFHDDICNVLIERLMGNTKSCGLWTQAEIMSMVGLGPTAILGPVICKGDV